MIKKLKRFYIFALIIGLPASLYTFVYATNVEQLPLVASVEVAAPAATPIVAAPAKTVALVKTTTTAKPAVKKVPVKKKVVAKKKAPVKKKEKLTTAPPLFTPATAPHTGR